MSKLIVIPMALKGRGVITISAIAKGETICEYVGDVIGPVEYGRRYMSEDGSKQVKTMSYGICLSDELFDGKVDFYIDGEAACNIGPMINHSCNANSCYYEVAVSNSLINVIIMCMCGFR